LFFLFNKRDLPNEIGNHRERKSKKVVNIGSAVPATASFGVTLSNRDRAGVPGFVNFEPRMK
jgi:hypothetical protein